MILFLKSWTLFTVHCSGILLLQAGLGEASNKRTQKHPCHCSLRLHHMQVAVAAFLATATFTIPGRRVHHTCLSTSVTFSKWMCMSWEGLISDYPRFCWWHLFLLCTVPFLEQALCINIPAMDPCLYVMRYFLICQPNNFYNKQVCSQIGVWGENA